MPNAHQEHSQASDLLPSLVESVRRHLHMRVGFLSEFKDGRRIFRHVASDADDAPVGPGDSDPLELTYCQRVVEKRIPAIIHNAQECEGVQDLDATHQLKLGAHISAPIRLSDGTLYGTLCCYSATPDENLGERDLAFLSAIAEIAASLLEEHHRLENNHQRLRRGIQSVMADDALMPVWQPITDVARGRIVTVESLSRFLVEPKRPPNEWFDEAATVDLGTELEHHALCKGLEILPSLPAHMRVSVNASAKAILDPQLLAFLRQQDLNRVVLEVTEHDIVNDYAELADTLRELRSRGLQLAVDDFGAGYSSLRHILWLDPEIIKLDLSLVRDIDQSPNARHLARAMVTFAADCGAKLVAEGVETQAELDTLQAMGIYRIQGYLLHKPMPRHELFQLLTPH